MKFLYYSNVAILSFSLTVLGGILRMFAVHPSILYTGLLVAFTILILGLLPYRIRSRNPFTTEFLAIFAALTLGSITWF